MNVDPNSLAVFLCILTLLSSFFNWLNENWSIKKKKKKKGPYHCALSENYMTVGKFLAEWVVSVRPWWDMVGWRTREKELARKWRRMVRGELLVRVAVTFQLYLSLLFLKSFYGVSTFTSVCRKSLHFTSYKKTRVSHYIF